MTYQLQRLIRNAKGDKEWQSMRPSRGAPYEWATEEEALDNIRFWNDGTAVRGDFRVVKS